MENAHRVVREVELDIDLIEEVVAEEEGIGTIEIVLAEDEGAPVLARRGANLQLVDDGVLDMRFPADAERAIAGRFVPGEAQPIRGGAHDEARPCAGVEQDVHLLPVDRAFDVQPPGLRLHFPFVDPQQLAVRGRGRHRCEREHEPEKLFRHTPPLRLLNTSVPI